LPAIRLASPQVSHSMTALAQRLPEQNPHARRCASHLNFEINPAGARVQQKIAQEIQHQIMRRGRLACASRAGARKQGSFAPLMACLASSRLKKACGRACDLARARRNFGCPDDPIQGAKRIGIKGPLPRPQCNFHISRVESGGRDDALGTRQIGLQE